MSASTIVPIAGGAFLLALAVTLWITMGAQIFNAMVAFGQLLCV